MLLVGEGVGGGLRKGILECLHIPQYISQFLDKER